jgi:hypothetical protein
VSRGTSFFFIYRDVAAFLIEHKNWKLLLMNDVVVDPVTGSGGHTTPLRMLIKQGRNSPIFNSPIFKNYS